MSQPAQAKAQTEGQVSSTSAEMSGPKAVALAMFGLLLLSYVLMAADRYLFPVLAADIRKTFGFSLSNTGLLSTIFTLGLGVAGLPTGFLLARYPRKAVLLAGIVIFSGATAMTTMVGGFFTMLVCLALQGIGMSMLATCMFALAASYFSNNRIAAIGTVNVCYGLGGFFGPLITGMLRTSYGTWQAPMLSFGIFGIALAAVILVAVRPWFSEIQQTTQHKADSGGADSLNNRNTILYTALSIIYGLAAYGFLGLYPTFLRENQHYTPAQAGTVIGFFGIGSLAALFGGWLGDKFPAKVVVISSSIGVVILGRLLYLPDLSMAERETLVCLYGIIGSASLYTNLAGGHVKALRRSLSSRGSGMFVTSLYAGATFGGYLMGSFVTAFGWVTASEIQMSLLTLVGAVLTLAIKPSEMSK